MKRAARIVKLLIDPTGRTELWFHLHRRLWPVFNFVAFIYRILFLRKVKIIAVIGSLGKTTTTYALRCALGLPKYKNHQSNVWSVLAFQLLKISPFQKFEVIEIGIGDVGQMQKFARLVKPKIVVVTSIASEHTGLIGSIENIRKEKSFMLKVLSKEDLVLFNGDDEQVLLMQNSTVARKVSFGFNNNNNIRCLKSDLKWPNGMFIEVQSGAGIYCLQTRIFSNHLVYPLLASFAVGKELCISDEIVKTRLETFQSPSGRMNVIQLKNGAILIRDDYKSTFESIDPVLRFLKNIPAKRKIVVLGDSIEMPTPWQEECRKIGSYIAGFADYVFFIGEMEEEFAKGALRSGMQKEQVFIASNNWKDAFYNLPEDMGEGDVILVKALAFQRFQRFSLALMGDEIKCERTWCEVKSVRCENCGWRKKNNNYYSQKTFKWEPV